MAWCHGLWTVPERKTGRSSFRGLLTSLLFCFVVVLLRPVSPPREKPLRKLDPCLHSSTGIEKQN